jgi:hypothetical protein
MPLTASNFIIEVEFKVSGNSLSFSMSKQVIRSLANHRTCTEMAWLYGSQRTELNQALSSAVKVGSSLVLLWSLDLIPFPYQITSKGSEFF